MAELTVAKPTSPRRKKTLLQRMKPYAMMYVMLLPAVCLIALFNYGPMYGLQIAFKDFNISLGILGSPWVGLKHFRTLFSEPGAVTAVLNTLYISFLNLFFGFPAPIILALLLNEIGSKTYKRVAQTLSYLPHFINWIVLAGLLNNMLAPSNGLVNYFIKLFGGKPIMFLASTEWFRTILVASNIWKGIGWGTILYLAALAGIDPSLYEAAVIDGASRMQRMRYVTLPSMVPVITIVLILNLGGILNGYFDQIFNLYNPQVYSVADTIDTFVFRMGLGRMMYSFSTAVGFFRAVVGFILVITVNTIAQNLNKDRTGFLF